MAILQGLVMVMAGVAIMAAPAARAADAPPVCTGPGALPPELGAWAMPGSGIAAVNSAGLATAGVTMGQAAMVKLSPLSAVTFALQPGKAGDAASFGGMLQLVVTRPGTYRVGLGSAAWIDLVSPAGTQVQSVAHAHGPACTGIRKLVDFVLTPGTYTLQLSANPVAQSEVLVIPAP